MKLFMIVLCLLSERYLQHSFEKKRFFWFEGYSQSIEKSLSRFKYLNRSWIRLAAVILPILALTQLVLYFSASILYGTIHFILYLIIFYLCLGPNNAFYPSRIVTDEANYISDVGEYLIQVNGQLFAVVFWFMVAGPIAALFYRLCSLLQLQRELHEPANVLTQALDWLPSRLTALFYLLVGNFKDGFSSYSKLFFSRIGKNKLLLSHCGLSALGKVDNPSQLLPEAERLVEHSVILLLVLLALLTLAAFASF